MKKALTFVGFWFKKFTKLSIPVQLAIILVPALFFIGGGNDYPDVTAARPAPVRSGDTLYTACTPQWAYTMAFHGLHMATGNDYAAPPFDAAAVTHDPANDVWEVRSKVSAYKADEFYCRLQCRGSGWLINYVVIDGQQLAVPPRLFTYLIAS